MGFSGPEKYVATELDMTLDERGNYKTAIGKYETSLSGIYAAGGKLAHFSITALVSFYFETFALDATLITMVLWY